MITRELNFLIAFILMLGLAMPAAAQDKPGTPRERQERMEKIESARTAFITDKLDLTPDQAQKFWPLYNEYNAKRKELRHKGRFYRNNKIETMSDKELQEAISNMFEHRQAELNLERSYSEKFMKVLSVRQLAQLYQAEREFTKILLKRLEGSRPSRK